MTARKGINQSREVLLCFLEWVTVQICDSWTLTIRLGGDGSRRGPKRHSDPRKPSGVQLHEA